jgi:hypothetical protein
MYKLYYFDISFQLWPWCRWIRFIEIFFYDINDVIIRALMCLWNLFFFLSLSPLLFPFNNFFRCSYLEYQQAINIIFFNHNMYKPCYFNIFFKCVISPILKKVLINKNNKSPSIHSFLCKKTNLVKYLLHVFFF